MNEKNYRVKINLAKLQKVAAVNLKGKTGNSVKCVVIPVEDNDIFLSEKGGIYLDLMAIAMKKESYDQTHIIKRSIPSEKYNNMSDEEKNSQPIVGSLTPMKAKQAEVTETAEAADEDDLPF